MSRFYLFTLFVLPLFMVGACSAPTAPQGDRIQERYVLPSASKTDCSVYTCRDGSTPYEGPDGYCVCRDGTSPHN